MKIVEIGTKSSSHKTSNALYRSLRNTKTKLPKVDKKNLMKHVLASTEGFLCAAELKTYVDNNGLSQRKNAFIEISTHGGAYFNYFGSDDGMVNYLQAVYVDHDKSRPPAIVVFNTYDFDQPHEIYRRVFRGNM